MSPKDSELFLATDENAQQQDEDEDDLSITSTNADDNDCDKEWDVEDILAERRHPDDPDAMQYLLKWEGFEIQDCTWEPVENLGDGLLTKWEENKAEIEAKIREPFDLTIFEAALAERAKRHARRNAKRRRLGLSLTPPFPPNYKGDTYAASPDDQDYTDSEDEAEELDDVDPAILPSSKPKPTANLPALPLRPPAKAPAPGGFFARGSKLWKKSGGTMTGYQGTAGRSSVFKHAANTKASTQVGPADIANPSAGTGSSTGTSAPSSKLARNLKSRPLKATRTQQQPAPMGGVNVFAGGKQPKKRPTLADVMADPSKAPKAFNNLRIMNIAKKRGIEKADSVGTLASIPSKFIIGNEQADYTESSRPLTSPSMQNGHAAPHVPIMSSVNTREPPAPTKSALHGGQSEGPPAKRKKSVRFTEEDDGEPISAMDFTAEPMDTTTTPPSMDADKPVPQASRKLSFETYQERGQGQTIQKLVKFGHAEPVMTNFTGIARHTAPWLAALKARDVIHLSSTCSSFHFLSQKQLLVNDKLSTGALEPASPQHAVALENVARSLQQGSIGLQLVAPEYSILVYPARCEGWDRLGIVNKPNPDAALRYLIYSSPLKPQAYPSEFCREPEALEKLIHPRESNDSELIEVLTELDFKQILPQEMSQKNKQAYMLLIPFKARQVLGVIMAWLRLHQPERPIFTLEQQNGWRLFNEAVQAGAGGTVISHAEFTLWKLEKIPHVWRILEDQRYTFWHLDTGEHRQPQFPSHSNAISIPGTLRFTRLFPYGRAFLITPSFAISEPSKLCDFLKWFKRYATNPSHVIVVCHGFPQFLRNITEEKQKEHDALASLNPDNTDVNIFFERAGRRKQDIDDHYRACQLLQDMIEKFGDDDTSEGIRKIHYLNEFIDPSDEQSLVNAFCWWTQLKLDRFRRFYVLGSDPNIIQRAYRYIDIPRYFDTEGSDPDIAGVLLQRQLFAAKLQEEADMHGTDVNIAWGTGGIVNKLSKVVGEWRKSICETPFSFPSTHFRTGDARELEQWIDNQRRRAGLNWAGIHPKVISWCDWNMADQFGDGDQKRSQFGTFNDWFTAPPPFSNRRNTWCGLFYTITDTWDEYMPQRKYERHPWIAIYRPKDVHLFATYHSFTNVELFIWDIAATDRAKFGQPMLDMQCKLIDYVYSIAPRHLEGCTLSNVYYSSYTRFQIHPNDNPLDITCRQINEIFHNTKVELPAKEKQVRESWIAIDPRLWQKGMSPMTLTKRPMEKASALALERIPQTEVDKLKPERMIWHPVPGNNRDTKTKCLNDLYEACLKARLGDPECDHIRYQYRPTQEWWADQVAEGRDYGYIHVGAAGKILDKLPNNSETHT
ncbi:hypothetical protein GGS21DRAFT_500699 [Xylaria nigripes]|nr:hypothetical protein GGS21DRAFT_500699 [Xylaria nigripes]